ncbi:peptidylprolyl isomerase [Pedobacter antarcticus]|uniref:Peptidylprolyl isomerase n=2 Tax=Pedobacter antarcticus TaxID=34086 RepID=A0A081PH69_9SPHI|nr:peptidylprolyl isomerase [Pedobacter antarcticus]KEQ30042.1 peptidylprolyl isomerase [Pedobacter antarcticus 4BY]SDM01430.1 periplasmic chaperone for outer membrane proteins SurA [Pedobacter antarcticus]SFF47977.1 periplasmic chaperone for outer membrane proteins SurA [Pedobacter antarcticus]
MKKVLWLASGLLFLFFNAQAQIKPQSKSVDKVVAVLGSDVILLSELNQQYVMYLNSGNPVDEKVKCYILQQMLVQHLLKQQAEIDSVMVDDKQVDDELDRRMRYQIQRAGGQDKLEEFLNRSVLQYKDELRPDIRDQLQANKMQGTITEKVSITPIEVKKYYDSYKKDSLPDIPAEYEVGEIVLHPELTKIEKQRYYDKLDAIRLRVKSGEDFGFLAKTYSEDPGSAAEGGDLGFFDRTMMAKEFTAYAFKLKPGDLSPVFETEFGYHVLQVIERRGEQVHARHILIRPQTTPESLKRVKLHADSVYNTLIDKKLSFSAAASLYSTDKESKYNGGMILFADNVTARTTFIPADKLDPKTFLVVDTMKVGEISRPVTFTGQDGKEGYKIVFLKSKIPPHKGNLEQDYTKFKEKAQQQKSDRVMSEWFEQRRKNTYIRIDEDYLGCDELKIWTKPMEKKSAE